CRAGEEGRYLDRGFRPWRLSFPWPGEGPRRCRARSRTGVLGMQDENQQANEANTDPTEVAPVAEATPAQAEEHQAEQPVRTEEDTSEPHARDALEIRLLA